MHPSTILAPMHVTAPSLLSGQFAPPSTVLTRASHDGDHSTGEGEADWALLKLESLLYLGVSVLPRLIASLRAIPVGSCIL